MRHFPSIKTNQDYRDVYQTGRGASNNMYVMYVKSRDDDRVRLGISTSKKIGNSVIRHRAARLLRECFRLNLSQTIKGIDIVVVVRNISATESFASSQRAYINLCKRLKIYDKENSHQDDRHMA